VRGTKKGKKGGLQENNSQTEKVMEGVDGKKGVHKQKRILKNPLTPGENWDRTKKPGEREGTTGRSHGVTGF